MYDNVRKWTGNAWDLYAKNNCLRVTLNDITFKKSYAIFSETKAFLKEVFLKIIAIHKAKEKTKISTMHFHDIFVLT